MATDQVETRRRCTSRKRAVVQAQQADHAERQAAHRHHGAEGHRTGEKARGAAALLQGGAELLVHQFQFDGSRQVCSLGLIAQRRAGLGQQEQRVAGFALVAQGVDQDLQVIGPLGQRTRPSQLICQCPETFDKFHQPPQQLPARAFKRIQRPVFAEQWRVVASQLRRRGKAQQQTVQTLAPGKSRFVRQAETRPLTAVTAPAHAGFAQPVAQQRQVFAFDAGAAGNGRLLQPGEDFFGGETALRQHQQFEEGLDQRHLGAQAAVGQAVGNPRAALAGGEHGFDKGCVALDIGGQHHHLIRR